MARSIPPLAPEAPWRQAIRALPEELRQCIEQLPSSVLQRVEEIRLRLGQPIQLCGTNVDAYLGQSGGLTHDAGDAVLLDDRVLAQIVQYITQSSLYAVEEELRRGFITIPGGHRVGVAGRAVLDEHGGVRTLRHITSVNIRIARECPGVADRLRPYVVRPQDGRPYNVLIISPPGCGKTTLLRDLVRQWSEGTMGSPVKVGVVDERSEIGGCVNGVPQFRIGPRTDVLDACPKADGMLMMIRSLSPDLLVTDEIGRAQDRDAILEAAYAGVAVAASAHAATVDEWRQRPHMRELFEARVFQRYVLLSRRRGPGTVEQVLDTHGHPLIGR